MIRNILLALALTASPAAAQIDEAHGRLLRETEEHVTVTLNPIDCWELDNVYGYYAASHKLLVVCQEQADRVGEEVAWTDNDYDTLRHEVHHLIQDCVVGGIGDGEVDHFIEDDRREEFITLSLPEGTPARIREVYADRSEEDINLEIEAFAVASSIDPDTIASAVNRMCSDDPSDS